VRWRGRARAATPKGDSDEIAGAIIGQPCALAEHYEALRERALGRAGGAFRLGLGLLLSRGVAAWMQAARQLAPLSLDPGLADCGPGPALAAEPELVSLLAGMALACVET
jgi:hypothetical protein